MPQSIVTVFSRKERGSCSSIKKPFFKGVIVFVRVFIAYALLAVGESARAGDPEPITIVGVENAFRVTDRILSGSQPESQQSFAALAEMGVTTIVSVDGGKPDVEEARKHGLRYIHLPFGYDAVPNERALQLARAARVRESDHGKIYVHCHHGKHRGPAAVAAMCRATANWTTETAEKWMHQAGTSTDYPGLYESIRTWQPFTEAQLDQVSELPEIAETGALVDAMVAIDQHNDALKAIRKAEWTTPNDHPDLTPSNSATLLWESFRETARLSLNEEPTRSDDYLQRLATAEQAANTLREALKAEEPRTRIESTFQAVQKSCVSCHDHYRNH